MRSRSKCQFLLIDNGWWIAGMPRQSTRFGYWKGGVAVDGSRAICSRYDKQCNQTPAAPFSGKALFGNGPELSGYKCILPDMPSYVAMSRQVDITGIVRRPFPC